MIRRLMLTTAVLALAACGAPEPEPTPEPAPAPVPAPGSAAEALTAAGFGPLRIGMTRAEVVAVLGDDANPGSVGGPDPESCDMFRPVRAPEGLLVMILDGALGSVWVSRNAAVETDRGLNVGDTAAEVKRVYGAAAEVTPHKYSDAPAEYITVWTTAQHQGPSARGLKYTIGPDGLVESIAGGGDSISYVEGCA